jgi:hypothetical protein
MTTGQRQRSVFVLLSLVVFISTVSATSTPVAKIDSYKMRFSVPGGVSVTKIFGTAWCLSPQCDVLVTNHHVATQFQLHTRIKGVAIRKQQSATSATDPEATILVTHGLGPVKQINLRDLALLDMKRPVAGMRNVPIFSGQLRPQEKVTFHGYPNGHHKTLEGIFKSELADGTLLVIFPEAMGAGASGSLLTNTAGEAIGTVFAVAEKDARMVIAIPIWVLGDFVRATHPELLSLFPVTGYRPGLDALRDSPEPLEVNETYRMMIEDAGANPQPLLANSYQDDWPVMEKVEDSSCAEVLALRARARVLMNMLQNFVALETLTFEDQAVWEHEIQVTDGTLHFRTPQGEVLNDLPFPRRGVVPGDEWHTFAAMLTDRNLAIKPLDSVIIAGQPVLRFGYYATEESSVCSARTQRNKLVWMGTVPCFGEVWTTKDFDVLRITQEMSLPPQSNAQRFRIMVRYGQLPIGIVPASMNLEVHTLEGELLRSTVSFSRYRRFQSQSVIHYDSRSLANIAAANEYGPE